MTCHSNLVNAAHAQATPLDVEMGWTGELSDEAQFQWLRYQLDFCVQLLPRATFTFSQMLKSNHGWISVCTNEWCYTYILLCRYLYWQPDKRRGIFWFCPTPLLAWTGTALLQSLNQPLINVSITWTWTIVCSFGRNPLLPTPFNLQQ